ncbi:hypothetical protein D5S17_23415 [Pseudonocardiaceae bacterium YIM PH 21723]|nr:hypothetical protein D5S17_23415 [Pseudonocardiaceae bacterium YIM PH 21723]
MTLMNRYTDTFEEQVSIALAQLYPEWSGAFDASDDWPRLVSVLDDLCDHGRAKDPFTVLDDLDHDTWDRMKAGDDVATELIAILTGQPHECDGCDWCLSYIGEDLA